MSPTHKTEETDYERDQRYNFLVSWLHSFRYKYILRVLGTVALKNKGQRIKVVEIGCAHAKLFQLINERFEIDYTGIEINPLFVKTARSRYGHNPNFRILHDSATNALPHMQNVDICVALEVLEHIPEHEVVRIVEAVATAQPDLFICSVPIEIGPAIWFKNVGSLLTGYMRHKEYKWAETFWAGLYQLDKLPPHSIHHKGFDWRWLAQTIRHNMQIIKIRRSPLGFLPAAFAFSIFMVAEPRR